MLAAQAEAQAFRESCAQAAETGKLDNRPLVVLTAGHRPPPPGMSGKTQDPPRLLSLGREGRGEEAEGEDYCERSAYWRKESKRH
jgi:hypothetical protein